MSKTHVVIVLTGHAGTGKSNLLGKLVNAKGDDIVVEEKEKENISIKRLVTLKHDFTIIDTPGHKHYMKNMITGTSQADCAILVISASDGEFEAGIGRDGSTREHAVLAYALGTRQLIVCVNKMDSTSTVKYNQDRFKDIVHETKTMLTKNGFVMSKVPFIPVSATFGDNIIDKSKKMVWYNGPTLLEALDNLIEPKRLIDKPLRIPLQKIYQKKKEAEEGGDGTIVVVGCIEAGILKNGMNVQINNFNYNQSNNNVYRVTSIELYHQRIEEASAGCIVGFSIQPVSLTPTPHALPLQMDLKRGMIVGDPNNDPPTICDRFTVQIIILNHPGEIKQGYTPIMYCHTIQCAVKFMRIIEKLDRCTGAKQGDSPLILKNGDSALVEIQPCKPIIVESYKDYPSLGSFVLRDINTTIGVGLIKSVIKNPNC